MRMNNSKESHQKGRSSNAATATTSAHLVVYSDNNDSN